MPVPTTIADLTTSEATNSPADSETITATTRPSDYLRAHAAIIKTLGNTVDALDAATQPLDAQLTTLAGMTAQQATDLAAVSNFMGTVLNDADAATAQATMGTEPTLLASTTVGVATDTITFTGLDISTHKSYRVEMELINGTASTASVSLFVNADVTSTNYYYQYLYSGGSTVSGGRLNTATLASLAASDRCSSTFFLTQDANGYCFAKSKIATVSGSSLELTDYAWTKTASTTNVVRIDLKTSVASGFGAGTVVRIYRGDK